MKRLFLGVEVAAPWPEMWPEGRMIQEPSRHITLAFLGNVECEEVDGLMQDFPPPPFSVGFCGLFDRLLFLPKNHPRVVAWHAELFDRQQRLAKAQKMFSQWFCQKEILEKVDRRPWLSHVTLARQPFHTTKWKKHFMPLPFYTKDIHLYESKGNLRYEKIWTYKILPPIKEIPHTADRAFLLHGDNLSSLALHAQVAIAFHDPSFLPYIDKDPSIEKEEEIVAWLNTKIADADEQQGIGVKAVSYSGKGVEKRKHFYQWEMIIDI